MNKPTTVPAGIKVKVYFNLHKKCLSVQHKGIVIAHVPSIQLKGVEFLVSESGRQRVIREQRKNVHAYVTGTVMPIDTQLSLGMKYEPVTYNPYKYSTFVKKENESPVHYAQQAFLKGRALSIGNQIK